MEKFEQTYSYKLIYVFSMPYETHKGMLKVGEATLKTDIMPNELVPNCHILNQAAKARIDSYTKTASMSYKLEYTELALKTEFGYSFTFKDKDVHKVLMNSGVHKVQPNGATGEEWFATDIETVKAAIKSVKNGKSTLSSSDFVRETRQETIDFREEQINAIEKTLKTFKKDDEMLWYAKMRFGKTLSALEVIRRSQYRRVIIATHRPVVDDGWSEDFKKIFFPGNSEHEYHYERKTKDSAYTFDEKTDAENDLKIRKLDKDGTYFFYFASVQDLRGSKIVGGKFNKNNAVFALDWDLIIIDEAHEGTQTELGDNVVKALKKDHTKVLALSGTPFNLLDKFGEDNVYTWDYVMEQKKRVNCLYRVSTIGQVEKDDIPMQRQFCREFIASHPDWVLQNEFYEKGVSGFKKSAKERDAMQELQQEAVAGSFDILLVYMFDRLGRRDDETPFVVEWFVRNGIEVWSAVAGIRREHQNLRARENPHGAAYKGRLLHRRHCTIWLQAPEAGTDQQEESRGQRFCNRRGRRRNRAFHLLQIRQRRLRRSTDFPLPFGKWDSPRRRFHDSEYNDRPHDKEQAIHGCDFKWKRGIGNHSRASDRGRSDLSTSAGVNGKTHNAPCGYAAESARQFSVGREHLLRTLQKPADADDLRQEVYPQRWNGAQSGQKPLSMPF